MLLGNAGNAQPCSWLLELWSPPAISWVEQVHAQRLPRRQYVDVVYCRLDVVMFLCTKEIRDSRQQEVALFFLYCCCWNYPIMCRGGWLCGTQAVLLSTSLTAGPHARAASRISVFLSQVSSRRAGLFAPLLSGRTLVWFQPQFAVTFDGKCAPFIGGRDVGRNIRYTKSSWDGPFPAWARSVPLPGLEHTHR